MERNKSVFNDHSKCLNTKRLITISLKLSFVMESRLIFVIIKRSNIANR